MADKFLILGLGDEVYALPATQVREIVSDLPAYPLPFTPAWVKGVLNRNGDPYTIIDLQELIGKGSNQGASYVLLNLDQDQVAVRITEVKEIRVVDSGRVHLASSSDGTLQLFTGALALEQGEIFVFNLAAVLERLVNDLQAS